MGQSVPVSIRAPPARAGRPIGLALSLHSRLVSIRAPPARAGRREVDGGDSEAAAVSIRAPPARAGRLCPEGKLTLQRFEFQSAPRPRGRGDCGPVLRLSHKGFIALFRQPANPSRPRGYSVVKERLQVSMPQAVVPRREIPVAGPALGVRGVAFITPTAHSGPTV